MKIDNQIRYWAMLCESEQNDYYLDDVFESDKYEKIDDIVKYCEEQNFNWTEVYKFQNVNARKAKAGEKIQTTLKNGTKETDDRTAQEGDWIVSNVDGGGEEWIVTDKNFQKKYEQTKTNGVYKPKGAPMLAVKINQSIEFKPPMWGGDVQRIDAGGYLLKDQKNEKDIYGIGEKEFHETYKATKGKIDEKDGGFGNDMVKRHFDEIFDDIVEEKVYEYVKSHSDVRKYQDMFTEFIHNIYEEIIEDAVDGEGIQDDEDFGQYIENNMDNYLKRFIDDSGDYFDKDGQWDSHSEFERNREDYRGRVDEVSDIDVDWDDKTIDDMTTQDYKDASKRYSALDTNDLSYLIYILEQCLDVDKIESWVEYWKTHEPLSRKVADYIISRVKALKSNKNTSDIERVKREEGVN